MAYEQVGFGLRQAQGGRRFYARRHWRGSLLGTMIEEARAAVAFLACRSNGTRSHERRCREQGVPTRTYPHLLDESLPPIDPNRIFLAGYSLGGAVALHAAALDEAVAGVAAFAGFTPMRTDSDDKPTGGGKRLSELHALVPRHLSGLCRV
jgi:pimeloyl-ACP methyl ester carboxylesterase